MATQVSGVYKRGKLELLEEPKGLRDGRVKVTIEEDPVPQSSVSLLGRRRFLSLPIGERRRILAEQAEKLADQYELDSTWKEWSAGDIVEY